MEVKIRHIKFYRAVFLYINNFLEILIVSRLSIWRQSHNFVFRIIYAEAEMRCGCAVQQSDRVRESQFFKQSYVVSFSVTIRCSCPFSDSVNCEDSCFLKWADQKRRCCVSQMMLNEQYF